MIDPEALLPLNEAQRRHFEVVLASLEDALARIEDAMTASLDRGRAITHTVDDLPPHFREVAPSLIAAVRTELGALAAAVGVEPRHHSAARTVRALLTSLIVELEDSDARRMRAYGAVDPALAPRLEPALAELRARLVALRAALRERGPGASS